ncbi:Dehydrogenase patE [Penicillium argentinense]|uniref:Dehydrogenase patE n=1 Tax=Penicillium argentinense TaxID=1131581 RepID=A0A9W9JXI3_9EURO|nr:Dehydrogenase patE [Penicillium argentinense]KAJ5085125.1 Dehydrogenase patE [Penicillium argentinense]
MFYSSLTRWAAFAAFMSFLGFTQYPGTLRYRKSFNVWPPWDATFDYVVVGGGTAGITIASRLAQNGSTVAVIEAGDYYELTHPTTRVPGAAAIGIGANVETATNIDWKFVANKVPGAGYRDIHYARGKCVGGSSALNYMIYHRPPRGAMDKWAEAVNDPSYKFDDVLPFYQKTAKFTEPDPQSGNADTPYNKSAFWNIGSPLHVSFPRYAMPFSRWVGKALTAMGLPEAEDFNSGRLSGHQFCTMTIRPFDESRCSSEAAFLQYDNHVGLMTIYQNTLAKKILFDNKKRATGIRANKYWDFTLTATKEVIISAGVFQSPQLLMVSGVGPAATLQEYGIPIISNLPGVGQNMWDHVFFGPSYQVKVSTFSMLAQSSFWFAAQLASYSFWRSGMLTNPSTDYLAFEKIPIPWRPSLSAEAEHELSWFPDDWPEVEYLAASAYVGNFSDPYAQQPEWPNQYASIIGCLVAPTSRGNVTIQSADIRDLPIISPNWLNSEADRKLAVSAYRRVRDTFQHPAMKDVLVGQEYFPGMKHQSDKELLGIVQKTMMTIFHASCTCKMGVQDDLSAVVDNRARVFGVTNLRVVDASAFPLFAARSSAVNHMLAEKIADNIINNS